MHQARNQKAGSQYLDYTQLVEHILKNLVVLDHIVFGLRIKVNLQTSTKDSGYNQLNDLTPRVRAKIQINQVRSWYEKEGSSIETKPYASAPLRDEPYPSVGTAPPPTQPAAMQEQTTNQQKIPHRATHPTIPKPRNPLARTRDRATREQIKP
jgi:hypothetical protein